MNYEELRGVGKIWVLMGVFSTCFFVGCGESQNNPPESVTPVTLTKPVPPEMEPRPVSLDGEYDSIDTYSEELEGSGYAESDFNEMDRNEPGEYPEDIPPPQQPAEEYETPTQEVSSNTQENPNPEVALSATSGSTSGQDQDSPAESPQPTGPAEANQNNEDDTTPLFAAQTDDDTDADDFSSEFSDDEDRG